MADVLIGLPLGYRLLVAWLILARAALAKPKLPAGILIPIAYSTLEKRSLIELVKLNKKIKCQIILGEKG